MLEPDLLNPRGYLQRADVRQANNRLMRSAGCLVCWPDHPEHLARTGNLNALTRPDLGWHTRTAVWGMKDPRFCATLLSCLSAGVFTQNRTRIVLVSRQVEDSARSMYAMPELSRLLRPRTLISARRTIDRYAEFAAWHAQHLGLPLFALSFDELLAHPSEHVGNLAEFVGCGKDQDIEASVRLVG